MFHRQGSNTETSFVANQRGSVAIVFSFAIVALIMTGGMAVDYGRSITMEAKVQAAADTAVLAATRAATINSNLPIVRLEEIARDYFDDNLKSHGELTVNGFDLTAAGEGYRLDVTGKITTTIMSVAGISELDVRAVSQAETGPGRPLEIALALDNTYSMNGAKMTALKNAANILVDKLFADTGSPQAQTKMALVPFSNYVNVDMSNRNAPWIDVPDDYSETTNSCYNTYPNKSGCTTITETCTSSNDGVTTTYSCTREQCTSMGDPVEVCQDHTNTYEWKGCVGSRDYPLNVQDQDYTLNKVPGLLNVWCSEPITPLTDDKDLIVSKIDEMSASHQTYIPAGLAWGWRVLTRQMPYIEGKTQVEVRDQGGIKAVVLMTDGANTKSPNYPDHWGSDVTLANSLTSELCTNIKNEEITIYTIAFEVSDTTIKDLLQSCATDPGYHYDAENSDQLATAFEAIAGQLALLKLTK